MMRVYRHRLRPWFLLAAGVLLIVAALDILWLNLLSQPPKTTEDGVVTTRGRNEQRVDYIWGSVFLVVGAGLVAGSFAGHRAPVVAIGSDGMALALGSPGKAPHFVSWRYVAGVERRSLKDEDTGRRDALVIRFSDDPGLPERPWRAEWSGAALIVDATGWSAPVDQVAAAANTRLERYALDEDLP